MGKTRTVARCQLNTKCRNADVMILAVDINFYSEHSRRFIFNSKIFFLNYFFGFLNNLVN